MNRTVKLVMNEFVVSGFAIVLIAARLIIGAQTFSEMALFHAILKGILVVSAAHFIGCLIVGSFAGKENKEWWDQPSKIGKKDKMLGLFFKPLIVTVPLFIYSLLAYLVLFQSWRILAFSVGGYIFIQVVNHFKQWRINARDSDHHTPKETVSE